MIVLINEEVFNYKSIFVKAVIYIKKRTYNIQTTRKNDLINISRAPTLTDFKCINKEHPNLF